jgi:RND family efflux transporter MFP subunit
MSDRTGAMMALCALLLPLGGCDREQPPRAAADPWVPVRVQAVRAGGDGRGIRYTAEIIPQTQVDVAFKVSGYVESIHQTKGADGVLRAVARGEAVTRETVLARIQDREYVDKVKAAEASLAGAQAALVKASQDFKRAESLFATQSMTAPDYDAARQEHDTARANVAAARAQLDEARQNLDYCSLKPPMDGVLLNRNIEVGTLVAPGTVAFVLADMTAVKVVFAVPDVMLKDITLGSRLEVTTHSLPERAFSGEVTNIAPAADTETRVFEIELTLPNPDGALKDGMVAALQVPTAMPVAEAAFVPITAVVRSRKGPAGFAVYVVTGREGKLRAHLRDVHLGEVVGNRVAVVDGIGIGDRVVVAGVNRVWDGSPVRILR